ncbi:MAG: HlyD family type I secretion periplasmic adaptor subunit, partial [Sphingomicrobium sp.]
MSNAIVLAVPDEVEAGNPDREIRLGIIISVIFFVLFLGWAALVPLDSGVHAQGAIAVAGNRQSVQHPDGGVVTAIHVREGQHVHAGNVLVELSAPELRAAERALTSDYLTLLAQRARLMAERTGHRDFAAPAEFASLPAEDRDLAQQALALQRSEMRARLGSDSAQRGVLGQRAGQLVQQQGGYVKQREALKRQQDLIQQELDGLMSVAAKGFASMNRVRQLQRAQAELQGQEAAMTAEYARAGEGIGETRMQSLSVTRSRLETIESDLKETQAKISETLPKLVATREQLQRSFVRAPATGQIVGLTVFTVGGVVRSGETLMDIVPDGRELVIKAQVNPADADDVYIGQPAQVRFVSVHNRTLPLFSGKVKTMSADSFTDEKSGRAFFLSEIIVPESEFARVRSVLGQGELRPGLPVEIVMTVRKRTALQYMLEPLTGA